MSRSKLNTILTFTLLLTLFISPLASAQALNASGATAQNSPSQVTSSPRLIVELDSPPLAAVFSSELSAASVNGKLDVNSTAAQQYINQLQAEQAVFVSNMQAVMADATVADFLNETGAAEQAAYQVAFNGLSINPGSTNQALAMRKLSMLPGVKHVYVDQMYQTNLYTSTSLINAPTLWNTVGGRTNSGAGIKIASIDGGVHHQAPMMDGTGYSYPAGYGPNGLGLTSNNNGKIIVSRAYFRPWDPPATGDGNPWPGTNGTSHGMHTSSTAAGGIVTATTNGFNVGQMSGVAPKAYVMSYRVFYYSVNGIGSFYATEGLAAIEDMVRDGADVVNNSWGGGPTSSGGPFDPIDAALQNAVKAGVFVSMSNGNAGPNKGTSDHPSSDYINVAASTTGGTIAAGRLSVPNANPNLQSIAYSEAAFGAVIPPAQTIDLAYLPAGVVDVNNVEGCNPWPANTFSGKIALIRRGNCDFSRKTFHAQSAGAAMVIIYNHSEGGDALISMSAGEFASQVTISAVFIGNTNGEAMVNYYNSDGAAKAIARMDTTGYQAGNKPDRIADFSSRGPGVGGTLKPDIAAPGVNILAQGYTPNTTGEARHLGYGQSSGTSMASPHVAGSAALLQQLHPDWSPAWIKSALMSTAKYRDIYLSNGVAPAQPLDMGSGRLNLAKAGDPGVILEPPSLSFGFVYTGTQQTINVTVTSVASATETYNLSTLYTGGGFTNTTALPGFSINPPSLTLNPGQVKSFQVTFNSANSRGIGDNQGYVLLDGTQHKAHMAAWARVVPSTPLADVLIIDNDFSDYDYLLNLRLDDYIDYYTKTLTDLGYTYTVLNYDFEGLPDAATLAGYRAILYYTGDNFDVRAGLIAADQDKLVEYLSGGGSLISMGQDLAATLNADATDSGDAPFLYSYNLSANWITDSVSNDETPLQIIQPINSASQQLQDVRVDLTKSSKYFASGDLQGSNERPISVTTGTTGGFSIHHNQDLHRTEFFVVIIPTDTVPITVTGAHIHVGDANSAGPVVRDLFATAGFTQPVFVSDSLVLQGIVTPPLSDAEAAQLLNGEFYINVHTTANPGGEIRDQIQPNVLLNEAYVDEIDNHYHDGSEDPNGIEGFQGTPLLFYPGPSNIYSGTVAMGYRQQPSLENPGISYSGRSVYATFGLEGVSESFNSSASITPTSRSELLGNFLDWVWAQPPTSVNVTDTADSGLSYTFSAQPVYGLQQTRSEATFNPTVAQVRWDFGDGTAYTTTAGNQVNHTYQCSFNNVHTVRAELTDNYGTVAIGSQTLDLSSSCAGTKSLFLPLISR
ncbi:MAG: S8 family serine peptidase [Caldilineaceae bacterium]